MWQTLLILWLGAGAAALAVHVYSRADRKLGAMSDADLSAALDDAQDWAEPDSLAYAEYCRRRSLRDGAPAAGTAQPELAATSVA